MLDDFLKLVDSYHSTIDEFKGDYKLLAKRLGIDTTNHYSTSLIEEKIQEQIYYELEVNEDEGIDISKLKEIKTTLVYKYLLSDEPVLGYLNFLETFFSIRKTTIRKVPKINNAEKWGKIISDIKNLRIISNNTGDLTKNTIRNYYPQEFDRVTQLKKLIELGCQVSINENIKVKNIEIAVNKLEKLVKKIGGLTLAKSIFHLLTQKKYSKYFERYHLTRQGNNLGMYHKPQIPFGYLLNLAVKYPYETISEKNNRKELNEIQNLSIAIATGSYNVQHYNQWTNIFQTGDTIINFFIEIALWDSIYSIIQVRPKVAMSILKDLFNGIEDEIFEQKFQFRKEYFFRTTEQLVEYVKNTNGPVIIYLSTVCKQLRNIEKSVIHTILDFLSHDDFPNKKYKLPSDFTEVDFQFNPLIKLGRTKYLLMDKSWCAPAFYESVAYGLRQIDFNNFESYIGYSIEKLIYKRLDLNNISYYHGNYSVDSINGECDLLVESNNAIILIEFKKKVLTRKAKSGIDINLLIDLSDSILSSQIQAGRTEIILREKGGITLEDKKNSSTITIPFNNRVIERISLTQLDFGGFHDRMIINQFFRALLTHEYGTFSEDKKIREKFEQLQIERQVWFEQFEKLKDLDKNFNHFPYFNCSFLSLAQLIEIINISNDNETFYKNLRSNKNISFGTLDFYREFEMKNKLNSNN